jgi:predicted acyltransferase
MEKEIGVPYAPGGRMLSVDFFRGITMFLLIGEFTGLFQHMVDPSLEGTLIHFIGNQFHHHPWHGLHFWDLVQPFFMFIVGVAIPLSVAKRIKRGDSYPDMLKHALIRSFLLLFFGWALYCIGPGRITFRFQNVLAQLSVTYLVAFLLMNRKTWVQLVVTLGILIITELAYRFFPVEGFNQPFVPDKNFGAYFDLLISGELSSGHWVSINAVPTIAHTVWGVLAGKLILSKRPAVQKIRILLLAGVIGLVLGYSLDFITPIIKRISTSSFVLASGGWCFLALCLSYWIIDVKQWGKWAVFFAIVGMNPLFIYLFAHVGGSDLVYQIFKPFTMGLFSWMGELTAKIITSVLTWATLWYMCYWLYRKKIFLKI